MGTGRFQNVVKQKKIDSSPRPVDFSGCCVEDADPDRQVSDVCPRRLPLTHRICLQLNP